MRRVHGLAALLAIIALVLMPGTTSASDPPDWEQPVQIGANLPSSWFPDIDADPTGTVRVVWSASLVEGDLNESHEVAGGVMISVLSETGWSEPADIFVMDGGIASRPMLSSDGAWAHLIFRYAPPGAPVRLVYSRAPLSADLGNTHSWSEPQPLTHDESYWAQLRVLPNGVLVAVYNQMTTVMLDGITERRTALYARRSIDSGASWSQPVRVSNGTRHVARSSLAVSPDGSVLLATWDIGYDNLSASGEPAGLATAISTDEGRTWSAARSLAGAYEQSVVATDGVQMMLVYRSTSEDQLYYQVSDDGGQSWSLQTRVPGGAARPYPGKHNFEKLSLVIDGDGRFILSWVGTNDVAPQGLSVMVTTWADDKWTQPHSVASPNGFPEYPRLAVALGGDIYMAYFVRDKEFDIGHYTMWIVHGTSDADTVAPASVTPAVVALPTQRIAPTPELFVWTTPATVATPGPDTLVVNRTPQDISTQPARLIAAVTSGSLLIVLALIVVTRWLLRM